MVTHARKVPGPGFVQTASLAAGASAPVRVLVISRNRNKQEDFNYNLTSQNDDCFIKRRACINVNTKN